MTTTHKIDRYKIKYELGRGGMATVVRAFDPRFERDVAIKILPRRLLHDPQFRTRFEREAKTSASLEHPAIVPVHDYGEQDGQLYLVMRFMPGGSLADRLKRGPLLPLEATRIIRRLASALDEAHSRGIIHRDLKPENILFDHGGKPYICDFGLAKLIEMSSTLTGNAIVGTPAYMSPDQARGDPGLDGRSDIYSLGAMLFEMLTGEVPYKGETSTQQIIKHITEPIPNVLDIRPNLLPGYQTIISRAMAKQKDRRFGSVESMADALDEVIKKNVETPEQSPVTKLKEVTVKSAKPQKSRGLLTLEVTWEWLMIAFIIACLLFILGYAAGSLLTSSG